MDYAKYKKLYQDLLSAQGREALSENSDSVVKQVNAFLDAFPKLENPDLKPDTPITRLTLREIYRRTLVTAIDILQDLSKILSNRDYEGGTTTRRRIFEAFTRPDRSMYVGLWILFFALVLYLLDSAA